MVISHASRGLHARSLAPTPLPSYAAIAPCTLRFDVPPHLSVRLSPAIFKEHVTLTALLRHTGSSPMPKLAVDPYLRIVGARDAMAIGDCSMIIDNRLPATAQARTDNPATH